MLWPNKGLGTGVGVGAQEPRSEGTWACVPGFLELRGDGEGGTWWLQAVGTEEGKWLCHYLQREAE